MWYVVGFGEHKCFFMDFEDAQEYALKLERQGRTGLIYNTHTQEYIPCGK